MNVSDCITADHLQGFTVVVGAANSRPLNGRDLDGIAYQKCGQYTSAIAAGSELVLNCDQPVNGQMVYIFLPREDFLKLCGVQIYRPGTGKFKWNPNGNINMAESSNYKL